MAKQNFYELNNILSTQAQYLLLLGERSNGKSYAVKKHCLSDAFNNNAQFIYLRRWREEIKADMIEKYFDDMEETKDGIRYIEKLTDGEWTTIAVYRGGIYFARYGDNGKKERSQRAIGYAMCLTGETHYKSLAFPRVENMIFEEFITDKGYLPNEVGTLVSLVSTVFRRNAGRVFMVGNTISQVCPYFSEWELVNVTKMKQGTIDIYTQHTTQQYEDGTPVIVQIAVEFCANSGNNSKMFFGKNKMIVSGQWESKEFPHLSRHLESYTTLFTMYYVHGNMRFVLKLLLDGILLFVYIYPCTNDIPQGARVVSDVMSLDINTTLSILHSRTKYDIIIARLLKERKVAVSDNLTGTNFFHVFDN